MRRIILILQLFWTPLLATSQPYNDWSDQEMLLFTVNPALMGNISSLSGGLTHAIRWSGLSSSPSRSNLAVVLPFPENKMSIGLELFSDKVGPLSNNGAAINYAYKFGLSRERGDQLSLGASIKAGQLLFDHDHLLVSDPGDQLFQDIDGSTVMTPSVGMGFNYMTMDPTAQSPVQMQLGASISRLLPSQNRFNSFSIEQKLQWYGFFGLKIAAGQDMYLKPTLLVSDISGTRLNYALRLQGEHQKYGWLMTQYSKAGFFTLQLGAKLIKTNLGQFSISASNSWYIGPLTNSLGNSRTFGLIYSKSVDKEP